MSLKTSLFNKGIIKSDLKRLWWISALEAVGVLMLCFALFDVLPHGASIWSSSQRYTEAYLMQYAPVLFIFQFIAPVIAVVMIFGYLNKSSAVSFMHSLPLKRRQLYFSHMTSAAVLTLSPVILFMLIMLLMLLHPDASAVISAKHILLVTVQAGIYAAFFACFASFMCMIAGNMISAAGLTYVLIMLPCYLEYICRTLFSEFLYGYYPYSDLITGTLYRSFNKVTPLYMLGLLLAAAVSFAAAVLVYRRRALENYGEIIAFPVLKPVFTFGAAICAGFIGYIYFTMFTSAHILLLLPFGLLGIIIAHMLMKRQFTLCGVHKPVIVYCVFILAVLAGFKLDISGFERRVPDIGKVESVSLYDGYSGDYYFSSRNDYEDYYDGSIYDTGDIQKIITLHEYAVKRYNGTGRTVTIVYKLKNGRTLVRQYSFHPDKDANVLEPVVMLREMKAKRFPVMDGTKKDIIALEIRDARLAGVVRTANQAEIDKITAALIADLEAVSYKDYYSEPWESALKINIRYTKDRKSGGASTEEEIYYIRPGYTNTVRVINELGMLPQLPPSEDVKGISLSRIIKDEAEAAQSFDAEYDDNTMITDRELVSKIYDFISNTPLTQLYYNPRPYGLNIVYVDGSSAYIDYSADILPDYLLELYRN